MTIGRFPHRDTGRSCAREAGQDSSSPSTDRSRLGALAPESWEPGVGSAEPELSNASSCWLK